MFASLHSGDVHGVDAVVEWMDGALGVGTGWNYVEYDALRSSPPVVPASTNRSICCDRQMGGTGVVPGTMRSGLTRIGGSQDTAPPSGYSDIARYQVVVDVGRNPTPWYTAAAATVSYEIFTR